jgi:perosamine synthetase
MTAAPSISWFSPEAGIREKQLVLEVLDSNYLNDGLVTRRFESAVADFIGVKHAVAVTSGTAAIALALMGLGIGPGDEVIVPDLTFIATANAARLAGASVRLVDVETARFSIDCDAVRRVLGSRTRAIVPVDVNGRGADYAALEQLAREKGLHLVSDSAEGLGSKWKQRFLGTFGDAGCFSFSANKTVTTGQGGMIVTNNTGLCHRLLELKDQGRRSQGTGGNDLHPVMGYNFKLTNLQSAVGLAQLERLQERLQNSRQRDTWYREILKEYSGAVTMPPVDHEGGEVLQWTDVLVSDRDRISSVLTSAGIGNRPFWYPLHTQKPYAQDDSGFPGACSVSERGLWLPSSFSLTREQARRSAEALVHGLKKENR